MPIPWWAMLIPTGANMLYDLFFGGDDKQTSNYQTTTTTDDPRFRDPGLGLLSPLLLGELTQNYDQFKGFGMPGGGGSSFIGDNLQGLIELLQREFGDILGQFGDQSQRAPIQGASSGRYNLPNRRV